MRPKFPAQLSTRPQSTICSLNIRFSNRILSQSSMLSHDFSFDNRSRMGVKRFQTMLFLQKKDALQRPSSSFAGSIPQDYCRHPKPQQYELYAGTITAKPNIPAERTLGRHLTILIFHTSRFHLLHKPVESLLPSLYRQMIIELVVFHVAPHHRQKREDQNRYRGVGEDSVAEHN